jgi:hypothetical protein
VNVPSGPVEAHTTVPAGAAGRVLRIADKATPGWQATLDGKPLKATTVDGWAQGFELPATGGVLEVRHDGSRRSTSLALQGVLLLVAVVLAAPSVRRADEEPEEEPQETEEPEAELTATGNVRTI